MRALRKGERISPPRRAISAVTAGWRPNFVEHPKISENFSGLFAPLCYIPAPLNEATMAGVLFPAGTNF
jgi:hypothetical protein